jgi:hypothetical protein
MRDSDLTNELQAIATRGVPRGAQEIWTSTAASTLTERRVTHRVRAAIGAIVLVAAAVSIGFVIANRPVATTTIATTPPVATTGAASSPPTPLRALPKPEGLEPYSFTAGAGSLWVSGTFGGSQDVHLVRIDETTGQVRADIRLPALPIDVLVADGAVWARTSSAVESALIKINVDTNAIEWTHPVGGDGGTAIGLGAAWVLTGGDRRVEEARPDFGP